MKLASQLRIRPTLLLHMFAFVAAYFAAFVVRFDFAIPPRYLHIFLGTLPVAAVVKLAAFGLTKQYRSLLRYVAIDDFKRIAYAAAGSSLLLVAFERFIFGIAIPRSVLLLDWVFTVAFVSGLRLGARFLRERSWVPAVGNGNRRRMLIVGAGDAGESLLREIRLRTELGYNVIGFLDDDPSKRGRIVSGAAILGTIDEAADMVSAFDVQEAVIAIPSATGDAMRRIVRELQRARIAFRTVPHVAAMIGRRVDVSQIRAVSIDELLGRPQVKLDFKALSGLLGGRTVMVTGAAGSIGSELCRQILPLGPKSLLLLDCWENGLFEIERELRDSAGVIEIVPLVANVTDRARLEAILSRRRPEVVFHAAAYKHVPMMEVNPVEAARNNVIGTANVIELMAPVEGAKFVLISTDKAVAPSSVMGMTKRLCELNVLAHGHESRADMVTVRFGNVLGSSGSVIPIFKKQIERGGPVTVTHPDMTRFFMSIPEAVQLVLQAAAVGGCGDLLLLDMGEPVKILDLARDLIGLSGLREPEDIRIEFTGIRPGEKLHEELHGPEESLVPGSHESVNVVRGPCPDIARMRSVMERLREGIDRQDDEAVVGIMREVTGRVVEVRAAAKATTEQG